MTKIAVVLLAYILLYSCDSINSVSSYYISTANAYAVIAALSIYAAIHDKSILLFLYFAVNILLGYISVIMISDHGYDLLKDIMWYHILNLSLIVQFLELVIIISGGVSACNHFYTRSDNSRSVLGLFRVGQE